MTDEQNHTFLVTSDKYAFETGQAYAENPIGWGASPTKITWAGNDHTRQTALDNLSRELDDCDWDDEWTDSLTKAYRKALNT